MQINSLNNSAATSALTPTLDRTSTPSSIPPAPQAGAAQTQISQPGQLFSRLQQLAQTDPTQFKQVAQSISDQLKSVADNSTGKTSEFAKKLSDTFAQAAQTGDMSAFSKGQEAQHAAHHHHHHAGGGGGGASNPIANVLSKALDQVNQVLNGGATSTTSSDTSAQTSSA